VNSSVLPTVEACQEDKGLSRFLPPEVTMSKRDLHIMRADP
jgi:hypothetical protein